MASLTIVGGNISALIHEGEVRLSCVDQSSTPTTPDSWTTSDPTKVTISSTGLIRGVAESGSATITAIKSGYTSGTITVTCTGGATWKLDPNTDTHTNGQSATSVTDSLGNTWNALGTAPTLFVNPVNGHKCWLFGGAGYLYTSADPTPFSASTVSVFGMFQIFANGAWANLIDYAGVSHGWWLGKSNADLVTFEVATGYVATNGGTFNIASGPKAIGFTTTGSAQTVYMNGVSVGTGTKTYASGTSGIPGCVIGTDASSEFLNGSVGLQFGYNRVLNSAEIAQITTRILNEIQLLQTIGGSATVGGGGSIDGAATESNSGSASVGGTGTVDGSGTQTTSGTSAEAGAGTVAGTATQTDSGTATQAGGGTVGGSATQSDPGSGSVAGAGTVDASGTETNPASGPIAGGGTLDSTATLANPGAGSMGGVGTVGGTATQVDSGSASASGGGTIDGSTASSDSGSATTAGGGSTDATAVESDVGTAAAAGGGTTSAAAAQGNPATGDAQGGGSTDSAASEINTGSGTAAGAGTVTGATASGAHVIYTVTTISIPKYTVTTIQAPRSVVMTTSTPRYVVTTVSAPPA